ENGPQVKAHKQADERSKKDQRQVAFAVQDLVGVRNLAVHTFPAAIFKTRGRRGPSSTSGYDGSAVQSSEQPGCQRVSRGLPYTSMPLYFMLHDAERFKTLIRPALAASWRQRSFTPCLKLQTALAVETARFFTENRVGEDESILLRVGPALA